MYAVQDERAKDDANRHPQTDSGVRKRFHPIDQRLDASHADKRKRDSDEDQKPAKDVERYYEPALPYNRPGKIKEPSRPDERPGTAQYDYNSKEDNKPEGERSHSALLASGDRRIP